MDSISNDLIVILQFLLPGFVAAWIFYSLTSYSKPSQFERVIQALIFTLFIQALVSIVEFVLLKIGNHWSIGQWSESSPVIASIIIAIIFGIAFSNFANNDKIHKLLRNKGITRETSFPSEWFGSFLNNVTFVVLHFKDERRLYGWPIEWPSESSSGHFVIADPSWLDEQGQELRITGVNNILVNVQDVKWVEFLEKTWEKENG
ncbi:MAG: hypothetical protein H8E21_13800 [Gammaproteobacteria bacterium]|nr:hypothetical protein [Gammaproteobacteria bacterium]